MDADVDLGGVDRFVFDIPRAQLAGLDFTTSRPNLHGSRLARADLRDADLHCAALVGVDLSGATLHRAKLSGVDLSGAKLVGADLTLANLRGAKGLTPEQVTQAEHWWLAQYDAALAKQLGLSKELIEYTTPRVTNAPAYRAGQHAFDEYISAVQTGAPPPPSATP
ncbi:MAG: pentapeptide repeat-containing protein [Myxococcales bacterium]|nr:pentapeptide repeat-containing protein [Myxococcales bacterium]